MRFFIFVACLLLSLHCKSSQPLEPVSLQLKWIHQYQFAGFYAAQEMGYYEAAGFNVEIRERDPNVTVFEEVVSGKATFGVADASIVLRRMLGEPVVLLTTVFQHSPLVFLTRTEDELFSPYELVGKTLMFQRTIDDASLVAMLMAVGISHKDYTFVKNNFDDYALMNTQDIDAMSAYSTAQPFLYQQKNVPVRIIDPRNYGIDFYGDLLFAHQDYVQMNPQRAQDFANASLEGWRYALDNPGKVVDLIQSRYADKKNREALLYEAEATRQVIAPDFVALGTIFKERFERIAQIYIQLGMAPEGSNFEGLFLESYLSSDFVMSKTLAKTTMILAIIAILLAIILWAVNVGLKRKIAKSTYELKKANNELKRQLFVIDQHIITSRSDLQGTLTEVSQAFCKLSGYCANELKGMNLQDLIHIEMGEVFQQEVWPTLQQGYTWEGEIMFVAKDQHVFWGEMHIMPIYADVTTEIIAYSATYTDITTKKLLEQQS